MAKSLQELRLENEARLLFWKHRGDIPKIVEDLRTKYESEIDNAGDRITVGFVEKVIKKFKKQQKVNDPYVAVYIMEYVFMGTKQRELLWDADDKGLEEYKFLYRSVCCDKATELRTNNEGERYFICLKCEKLCNVYRIPNLDVFEMNRRIRVEKRHDEIQLVKAVESLGFGGEKAPIIKQTNYQLFTEGPGTRRIKQVKSLPPGDQQLIVDMDTMDPRDRETVRKNLEMLKRDEVRDGQD